MYKFAVDDLEYADFLSKFSEQSPLIKCEINYAHNLIYGAIDYAEELGFSPNKDFKITEHLLDTDLIDDGIDELEFGRDGKPFFVPGPYDDVKRITGILEKNVGAGNYDYILPAF